MRNKSIVYVLMLSIIPVFAQAHVLSGIGFGNGALHPLSGIDHLLAMVAVGIVSVQLGRKYVLVIPLMFVSLMVLGGVLGIYGFSLPFVEIGIALSVLFSGLAIVLSRKISIKITMSLIALSAIFHGHAHGSEMPVIANPLLYTAGFVLSTAALHFSGVLMGNFAVKIGIRRKFLKLAGAGIGITGLMILFGVF